MINIVTRGQFINRFDNQVSSRRIWCGQNQIAEFRAKRTWTNATKKSGEVEMANTEWVWQMKISKTDDPSLRRLDVEVFIKGEDALKASATGFIARL